MTQKQNLKKLFEPKSIAIVGATDAEGKVGQVITENILKRGYRGKVYLINPHRNMLYEKKCYARLEDISRSIDVAIIIVPSKFVVDVVHNAAKKVKNFVVISAGFSETGAEGKKREQKLLQIAEGHQLTILGPNCLGFITPSLALNASFAGGMPKKGSVALVSQSGALAVAILDKVSSWQGGFSTVISIGNKMHLGATELLEYLATDTKTKVIALYLEGVSRGQGFLDAAMKIAKKKPIIILKAGRSEEAQKAIALHTGALAGSDEVMNAVFAKTGIVRARSME